MPAAVLDQPAQGLAGGSCSPCCAQGLWLLAVNRPLLVDPRLDPGAGSWHRAGPAGAATGASLLLPEPPHLLPGQACRGLWVTAPSWHGAASGQLWPRQRDKEREEAAPASPGTRLCPRESGRRAGSSAGGMWRGREQAPGESRLLSDGSRSSQGWAVTEPVRVGEECGSLRRRERGAVPARGRACRRSPVGGLRGSRSCRRAPKSKGCSVVLSVPSPR